ncbi:ABC-F type ribosomal protection protein [Lachnospiraceae bacterium MD1]|uniref:ABC-F type ribosomal protection protein n=1 Tax=Variimorphobacter saccharofermentans TaxID=2755051 RepID=A0A839JY85_9FIRM|nr:ABC-F type ribosomal protection protein [Variimorphobacter saccharofermentans]MBB2182188.1 ABC-F type ribosomal protection protein [Variimorphobacter saccharofermentans]
MIELSVQNLTKYYGANKIFQNISFEVKSGDRVALIGQNGCGKTTIMKIIMGVEEYQGGNIYLRKGARLGYLDQIPEYEEGITTLEVLQSAFDDIDQIRRKMKYLEEQFQVLKDSALEKAIDSYGKLTEQYELSGGYEIDTKINRITEGLQINDTMKNMSFHLLSGGEKTRVILAKILLEEPDIMLLDEPTNHLDLSSIEWLEGFLKEYQGAVFIISHDRYFLDSIANMIYELEFDHISVYHGNYSYYVLEKERRFLLEFKNYQNQQKKIAQMEEQIKRYRIWGQMRDSEKMFKRAKELEKRLEKIEVLDRPILEKRKMRLNQNDINRTGKIVLEIQNLSKAFDEKPLLECVDISIFYQDHACILGKNGSGKSTLLKMILGELEPDQGVIKYGSQLKIGYLPQHVIFEDEDLTLLEHFSRAHDITTGEARSQLAKVLFFQEDVHKKIKHLSGGEKSRLRLCSLTFQRVNFMILDEPTNHLDITSREVLEDTLSEFEGTILFVSHDRYFINKIADKIMEIEDKTIKAYPGDYTYYQEEHQKEILRKGTAENQENEKKGNTKINNRQINNKQISNKAKEQPIVKVNYRKKLAEIEGKIEKMELQMKSLEEEMNSYNSDAEQLREIFEKKELVEKELEQAYEEWEQLTLMEAD